MFWDSVLGGLKVFTFWETYAAGLLYLLMLILPLVIVGWRMQQTENAGAAMAGGCLSMLLMPAVQVAAMAILVLTLAPIILGFGEDAMWAFPWQVITNAPGAFLKLVGTMLVATIVIAFVPLLGQLQSVSTLILGGIALTFLLGILDSANPGFVTGRVDLIPGFFFAVGLIVVGGALSFVGILAAGAIAAVVDPHEEGLGQLLMMPVGAVLGLVPVFIYGAWLGLQLKGGA